VQALVQARKKRLLNSRVPVVGLIKIGHRGSW
jgi:hypothetical protein